MGKDSRVPSPSLGLVPALHFYVVDQPHRLRTLDTRGFSSHPSRNTPIIPNT